MKSGVVLSELAPPMDENEIRLAFEKAYHSHKLSTQEVAYTARTLLNDESLLTVPEITLPERLRAVLKHDNLPEQAYSHIMNYCPVEALVDEDFQVATYLISHPLLSLFSYRQLLMRANFIQLEDLHTVVKKQKEDTAYRLTYPIIFSRILQRPDVQERTHTLTEHVQTQHFYRTLLRCENQTELMMKKLGILTDPEWR